MQKVTKEEAVSKKFRSKQSVVSDGSAQLSGPQLSDSVDGDTLSPRRKRKRMSTPGERVMAHLVENLTSKQVEKCVYSMVL